MGLLATRVREVLAEGGMSLLLRRAATQARTRLTMIPAGRALRRTLGQVSDVDGWVGVAFDFRYDRLRLNPHQVRSEITALLDYLRQRTPTTVLEIGTASGATLMLFTRVAGDDATLVTVDLPTGFSRERLHRAFARSRQTVRTVRADSHAPATKAAVWEAIEHRPVDFLFIDGDHSYAGVKADYEDYAPFVRPGGAIAFHDIVPGPEEFVGGVPAFWQELKQGRTVREFVESWEQGGLGIGLIEVPPDAST